MALILGTYQSMISRWERGKDIPKDVEDIINMMVIARRRAE